MNLAAEIALGKFYLEKPFSNKVLKDDIALNFMKGTFLIRPPLLLVLSVSFIGRLLFATYALS